MEQDAPRPGLARALVLAHGTASSSYQILNPGISHWFGAGDEALVGYVRHRRFLVAAGGPVCAPGLEARVQAGFEEEARARGLRVCWFGAEDPFAATAAAAPGHSRMLLGAQPAWHPARWAEAVEGHASLRAQLHRARNKGVEVREWRGAAAPPALHRCLAEWLSTRGAPPMHFLVEPETLGQLEDRRIFLAEAGGRGGALVGFLVASPVPARKGWLVEQIIRGEGAVNGTSELLVDSAIRTLAAGGAGYVTLGLSPLSARAGVGDAPSPLWLSLLLGWVRAHTRRFYNFEGLDAFKAKLRPEAWEPLYAVTDRPRVSPAVLHAIGGAFTGGSPEVAVLRALAWSVGQEARALKRWASAAGRRPAASPSVDHSRRSR